MLPKISTSRNIARSVLYNEQKVKLGTAERLVAANFLKDLDTLTTEDINRRFQRRMELNERVHTCLHITLNFDPQDKFLKDTMTPIIRLFMKEIGFEHQPYAAWRHNDAGHPHCHIVTTHIQANGDPIDLYKIGQNQAQKARRKIEAEYNLVTAEMKKQQRLERLTTEREYAMRVDYGEKPLTTSISDVLEHVVDKFKYCTFDELNAILRHYNIQAYRGQPGTKLHESRGLLYRALDEKGHFIGHPLKASFFDFKPTLDKLEQKYAQNLTYKQEQKQRMKDKMIIALAQNPDNLPDLRDSLTKDGVELSLRYDQSGNCTGMTAVDFKRRVVFTGDELEGRCNQQAIQQVVERQRLRESWELTHKHKLRQSLRQSHSLRIY
jgi:hypothetical protein